ncbi:hypothetical protein I4U23_022202 [Adineta vaga]|nr:hypothetical protein I4U23_022202 [Adineta vaga]
MFIVILILFSSSCISYTYQDVSIVRLTDFGYVFAPLNDSMGPFLTLTEKTVLLCHLQCNQRIACRVFDFDQDTSECRLWSDDLTTGMLSLVLPSKPRSTVGAIQVTSNTYASIHNQPCNKCVNSRYEICDPISLTCKCPSMTFWNGNLCVPQRYSYQSCSTIDSCRPDLQFECKDTGCNSIYQCLNQTNVGITVAGFCNATAGGGVQGLSGPWGVYVTSDNTLYVTDYDTGRVQAYPSLSRSGITIMTISGIVEDVFVDTIGYAYMTAYTLGSVFVSPTNTTLPISKTYLCTSSSIALPYGIAVDRYGNIYISDYYCHVVMKWTPNATTGIVVAGQLGIAGISNNFLSGPKFIFLDEINSALYVTDCTNNRIQKFLLGVSTTGITVAGINGYGSGLSQLKIPAGICVSLKDQSIYVGDQGNHRVMKWKVNATQGSIIAGSTGVTGSTSLLLDTPGDVALDPTETFLYVADYGNHRVQRFRL